MRALTVKQPWADLIAYGYKTVEYRTWRVVYRGPLVITSAQAIDDSTEAREWLRHAGRELLLGVTICTVVLTEITGVRGDYAWHLSEPMHLKPTPVTGKQGLWTLGPTWIIPKPRNTK